jgi:hypothetical protein
MNIVDVIVVIIVIILVGLVVFFHFIFPKIKKKGPSKKAQRLVKDYYKAEGKDKN